MNIQHARDQVRFELDIPDGEPVLDEEIMAYLVSKVNDLEIELEYIKAKLDIY